MRMASPRLPLRVIDIHRTLEVRRSVEFRKPKDWDFHILSHTWSAAIRELSQRIGELLSPAAARSAPPQPDTNTTAAGADEYGRLFQLQDLSGETCYADLIRLFQLLQRDGVEFLWFDALCINQCEKFGEKNLEIKHMGHYYSLSKGCYVLTHGIREGYTLWGKPDVKSGDNPSVNDKLPRWFHRVWTFQEFLLPRELSFIVQGVDHRFVNVINALMKQEDKGGFCKCFLGSDTQRRVSESLKRSIHEPWIGGFELRNPEWRSVLDIINETKEEVGKWGVGPIRVRTPIKCCNGSYNDKTDKLYMHCLENDKCKDSCGQGNGTCLEKRDCADNVCMQPNNPDRCKDICTQPTSEGKLCRDDCEQPNCEDRHNLGICMQPTRQDGWREDCKQSNGVATNHKMPIESLTSIQSDPFIHATASICDACKSRPMIRHAPQSENSEAPQPLYFIDRQVYLALMQCHSRMVREGGPQDKPSESIQFLRGLYCAWETEGNWRPCHALCEVGARECMLEHEEDRVLSILGLLGLQVNNLRTGKSLKEQVISIIKEGGGVELVIEFCTMNQKGGKDAGFSWAPDFHGKNKKLEYALRPLHSDIEVFNHEFGQDGSLKLKAKIARGHVVPKDSTCPPHGHSACHSHLLIISRPTSSSSPDYLEIPLHLELAPHHKNIDPNTLFFGFHGFDDQTSLSGSFQVPLNPSSYAQACKSLNISYPVRLLLLGTDEGGSKLVMVCIPRHDQDGNTLEELHKIGCFALRKDKLLDFHALLQDAKEELCVVGGFGNDLSQHVQIHE